MHKQHTLTWVFLGAILGSAACGPARPRTALVPETPPPPPTQNVYLTVDADRTESTLVRWKGQEKEVVCQGPCNRVINVTQGMQYQIELPESMPTRPFLLFSPQDPVVWLHVKAQPKSTRDALYTLFLSTALGGLALGIGAGVAVPFVSDEARTPVSALAFTGMVLALPVSGILGPILNAYSESELEFRDPRKRPDLAGRIR